MKRRKKKGKEEEGDRIEKGKESIINKGEKKNGNLGRGEKERNEDNV